MPAPPPRVDPARCPLCGRASLCAVELEKSTGRAQPPCWCTQAGFSQDLLARVPQAARDRACICAACTAAGNRPAA